MSSVVGPIDPRGPVANNPSISRIISSWSLEAKLPTWAISPSKSRTAWYDDLASVLGNEVGDFSMMKLLII